MMRAVLLVLLTSCAPLHYTTKHGVVVTDETRRTTPREVEDVFDAFLGMSGADPYGLIGYRLRVTEEDFYLNGHPLAGLIEWGLRQITVKYYDHQRCLAMTSLPHELTHYKETRVDLHRDEYDKDTGLNLHANPYYWGPFGFLWRLEWAALELTGCVLP